MVNDEQRNRMCMNFTCAKLQYELANNNKVFWCDLLRIEQKEFWERC